MYRYLLGVMLLIFGGNFLFNSFMTENLNFFFLGFIFIIILNIILFVLFLG